MRAMKKNRDEEIDSSTPSDWKPWERSIMVKEETCAELSRKYYRIKELAEIINKSYFRIRRLIIRKYIKQCVGKMGIYFVPKKPLPEIAQHFRVEIDA